MQTTSESSPEVISRSFLHGDPEYDVANPWRYFNLRGYLLLAGVDDAVGAGGLDVVDRARQGGQRPQQAAERIGDDLDVHPVRLVLAGVCAVRRLLFEWK